MPQKILTPTLIWNNFDDSLPLKENIVNVVPLGKASCNYIYFSGRQTLEGRVRIYGAYAKQTGVSKGSMLILPDVTGGIDKDLFFRFVNEGYDVITVDLGGERSGEENYTKYPSDVYYANYEKSGDFFNYAKESAINTSWYEWVAVARYAVSFLNEKCPNKPIFAMGLKHGANVLWQLLATDKRISAGIFVYGAGFLAYNGIDKHSDVDIEMNDERIRFIAGVEAQSYAQFVTCPTLYFGSTYNCEFNAERAIDTLSYVDSAKKCHFNISSSAVDVLGGESLTSIDLFLNKYIQKEAVVFPDQPHIEIDVENEFLLTELTLFRVQEVESAILHVSFDGNVIDKRVWHNYEFNLTGKNKLKCKSKIFANYDSALCFATVKYKNGLVLSSKFAFKKFENPSKIKLPNLLYNSQLYNVEFFVKSVNDDVYSNVISENVLFDIIEGPSGINGISSHNTLTTYAIRDLAQNLTSNSFIKLDVYATSYVNLTLVLTANGVDYTYNVPVSGGNVWQNLIFELIEFKSEDGQTIEEYTSITSLTLKSIGVFAVNNIMVL